MPHGHGMTSPLGVDSQCPPSTLYLVLLAKTHPVFFPSGWQPAVSSDHSKTQSKAGLTPGDPGPGDGMRTPFSFRGPGV